MGERRVSIRDAPEEIERLSRLLTQSVNARVLALLIERREDGYAPDDETRRPDGAGWMYLSEIADATDEAPGTVGSSVQKLLPVLEERRVKGRRFFRARIHDLVLVLDEVDG